MTEPDKSALVEESEDLSPVMTEVDSSHTQVE